MSVQGEKNLFLRRFASKFFENYILKDFNRLTAAKIINQLFQDVKKALWNGIEKFSGISQKLNSMNGNPSKIHFIVSKYCIDTNQQSIHQHHTLKSRQLRCPNQRWKRKYGLATADRRRKRYPNEPPI